MFKKKLIATILAVGATLCFSISTASAEVVFNERNPFSFPFFNACTGEDVWVDGIVHEVVREKVGEDGSIVLNTRINAHGFGTGLISGAEYVWNDNVGIFEMTIPEVSFTLQYQGFLRLIGKGKTPNELLRADFTFLVEFDPFSISVEDIQNISCVPD